MEFRLKDVISIVLLLLMISCKTKKVNNQPYTQQEYVLSYKNAVLYGCINEKTNNEFGQLLDKYNNTASKEVAILFHDSYNKAMTLGITYSKNIRPHTYYGDLKEKEFIFSDCVAYAFSKEVDSIAFESYENTRDN